MVIDIKLKSLLPQCGGNRLLLFLIDSNTVANRTIKTQQVLLIVQQ